MRAIRIDKSTPRQAVKSILGREKLETLLLDFESKNTLLTERQKEYQKVDIDFLKRELGL